MKKIIVQTFLVIFLLTVYSCKKNKNNTCEYDICDSRRKTMMVAKDWTGTLGYYNDLRKWAFNVAIPNSIDGIRTCIICTDIPDSLKTMGRFVTFSGDLKESSDNPKPVFGRQEIYFVTPIKLK